MDGIVEQIANEDNPRRYLTGVLDDIAEYTSVRLALGVALHFGGTDFRVPVDGESPTAARLREALGDENAAELMATFPHEHLHIPRCARLVAHYRNLEIARRYRAGEKQRELARAFGLTTRCISKILSRYTDAYLPPLAGGARQETPEGTS